MKKTWIWILVVGLLICVIVGLTVTIISLFFKAPPLAPEGEPFEPAAAAEKPEESEEPGKVAGGANTAGGTGNGSSGGVNSSGGTGTAGQTSSGSSQGGSGTAGSGAEGIIAGLPIGQTGGDSSSESGGTGLPNLPDGVTLPSISGDSGSDFTLPDGLSEAAGILGDTAGSLTDGSFDPNSALDSLGEAAAAAGSDSPVDVSGATDALQDTISGVTGGNE